ncbi:MAG: hypothetical protein U0V48_14300 [Anaerolineales bacterium]
MLDVTGDNTNGYVAKINIGLDLMDTKVGASDTFGGPPQSRIGFQFKLINPEFNLRGGVV